MRTAPGVPSRLEIIVCCVLLGCLVRPSAADPEIPELSVKISQAKDLEAAGNYEAAVQLYREVALAYGQTSRGQEATVLAAAALAKGGLLAQAVEQYDVAIAMNAKAEWTQTALYNKSLLCKRLGRIAEATSSLERLRLEFPDSQLAADALAELNLLKNMTAEQQLIMAQKEDEARELLSQARTRVFDFDDGPGALVIISRIESEYAETTAATEAQMLKGTVLQRRGAYAEAAVVYASLIQKVAAYAPDAEIVKKAKFQLAEATLNQATDAFETTFRRDRNDGAGWQEVRSLCRQVLHWGLNGRQMAEARVMLAGVELIERRPQRALEMAEALLAECSKPKFIRKYPKPVLDAALIAAEAARLTRDYPKALAFNERVKEVYATLTPEQQKLDRIQEAVRKAYYQDLLTSIWKRAQPEITRAVGEEITRRFPKSREAALARMMLGLPASMPAPQP